LIRTSTQERGNIYIYSYINNINIFASHKHKIQHRCNTNMVTIMIVSSCDFNQRSTRESLNYFHNPIVQGVEYSLFIMLKGDGVDGVEGATESGSDSVSPPTRSVQICLLYFVLLHRPITKLPEGSFIYLVLGQAESVEMKFALIGCMRGEMGPTMWSRSGPVWTPLFSSSLHST
jgi:hypothetical protein